MVISLTDCLLLFVPLYVCDFMINNRKLTGVTIFNVFDSCACGQYEAPSLFEVHNAWLGTMDAEIKVSYVEN